MEDDLEIHDHERISVTTFSIHCDFTIWEKKTIITKIRQRDTNAASPRGESEVTKA